MISSPSNCSENVRTRVVYYNSGNGLDPEKTFPFQVLKLAIAKSGEDYVLRPSPIGKVTEQRATEALIAGETVDVAWLGANSVADDKLLPVRIPIDRGLLGYRLFLIDGSRQAEFSRIRTFADLKKMVALQGTGWADVAVLRSAGLPVQTGSYKNLYRMMMAGRGDYYPRAAFEAFSDQAKSTSIAPGIVVEKTILLHYALTQMFYVRRSNTRLHDDIYRGFLAAYHDGSYDKLFRSNPDMISVRRFAKLKSRKLIEIENPLLSPETKAIDQRYWFKP